ncbi:MAG: CsoR family transcriptional regulator, copper-sensing transcriptional repressor [Thermoanaerobacterium sp.]|jgi:DNA-binding FrmR family transcriptional regulator|uniref:DNA-binding FrmR family transcriptional regulator n=1 Tax=Thermoanaerobacterium butyriciformans TaxID=1702242 RepID=A0ABS4NIE6_9THEO|nr:metal-sensitive transcriptional regulator [Thermoanaerobacterium butyriciformans]MDI3477973.1 CsoR family transcriptional regulator, copper-sensing transcriptional repressor [Thermoanaerobacterium sp.]WHE07975.1 metal-sensitive transcriptional regulator [Thermoanaerobacterium thermosaccharolyticum]MBP2073439.1 DNA-binding FrmR family transcriptional regulator [Thermoanaerobacterium butyriciformans]MDK2806316.1 CsoR family transcriptional regulator, copper-sensing transcriptional repressor [T
MNSYHDNKEDLLRRLKKIEGQIKGIQKMIEKDTYCVDVLIQVAAVRSAINSVGKILLKSHTLGCVKDAINTEKQDDMIDELVDTFMKFMK